MQAENARLVKQLEGMIPAAQHEELQNLAARAGQQIVEHYERLEELEGQLEKKIPPERYAKVLSELTRAQKQVAETRKLMDQERKRALDELQSVQEAHRGAERSFIERITGLEAGVRERSQHVADLEEERARLREQIAALGAGRAAKPPAARLARKVRGEGERGYRERRTAEREAAYRKRLLERLAGTLASPLQGVVGAPAKRQAQLEEEQAKKEIIERHRDMVDDIYAKMAEAVEPFEKEQEGVAAQLEALQRERERLEKQIAAATEEEDVIKLTGRMRGVVGREQRLRERDKTLKRFIFDTAKPFEHALRQIGVTLSELEEEQKSGET